MSNSLPENNSTEPEWTHPRDGAAFDDPLLECLLQLSHIEGRGFTADSLTAGLPLEDDRLTPELFPRAAKRAGFSSRMVQRKLRRLSNHVLPVVLLLKGRRACLLLNIDARAGKAQLLIPESGTGEVSLSLDELESQYSGYALFVRAEHKFDERAPEVMSLGSRHWFWGTLFKSWRIYRDVLMASFLINLFALASPLFIMNVYDRVVPNNAVETLWVLAIGVTVVYLFDFVMRLLRGYFIDVAGKKADILLSAKIFQHVLNMKMEARPPSVGAFANNLREFDSLRDFITSATITTLVDFPFMFFFIAVVAFIGGPIALVPAVAIPLVVIYGLAVQGPLRRAVESSFRASAQKGATLIESLTGIETIKHLGAESRLQHKWEGLTAHIADWGVRSRLISASAVNVATFFQQLSQVGVIVVGVYLVTEGELSMGGLIACVMLTGRALGPIGQYANLSVRYFQAKTALTTTNQIMALPVDRPEGESFLSRPHLSGGVEFAGVSFSYPGQETKALNNVSFRINPGEHVAIIGRVGSGKTTIEKLVQGLYAPSEGAIRVDGTDMRQIDPADLRRNMAYVPQDVLLFFGSVRDNIMMGTRHADDAEILRVAGLAGVTEFVNHHPLGFDLQVGERGDNLSGGQRQSIAIARALLNDPPFLLMDEPSNSMDNTTEQMLKKNLAEYIQGKTLLLVTHRASLLDLVDRVIVMDHGMIIADGAKEQVLSALREGTLGNR